MNGPYIIGLKDLPMVLRCYPYSVFPFSYKGVEMNAKIIGVIILLVLMVIFAIQNAQLLMIRFLFWGFEASAVLSILVSFAGGFLAGWLVAWTGKGKKKEPLYSSR